MSRQRVPRNIENKTDEQLLILALDVHRPTNSLRRSTKTCTRLQKEFDRRGIGINIADGQSIEEIRKRIRQIRREASEGFWHSIENRMTKP